MELSRFYRALRDRWILVVLFGVAGLASAVVLSTLRGTDGELRIQATAPIQFQVTTEEGGGSSETQLEDAQESAQIAAQTITADDPLDRFVTIDTATGQLLFSAITPTADTSVQIADDMRRAYLDVDPVAGGADVDELLVQIEDEADRLTAELATLVPSDPAILGQHQFIANQRAQLQQRLLDIAVLRVTADDETRSDYDVERNQIELALQDLAAQEALLPPLEPVSPSLSFQQTAIQQRLDVLAVEYARLFLRKLGVTSGGTTLPVRLSDLTPPPPSLIINGLLGLVVGLGLAALAISVDARFRRPIWVADDISLSVLGEIPPRRWHTESSKVWYDRVSGHPRKASIQALRAAVEGRLPGRSYSLAVVGIRSGPAMMQAAVLDLGASFASAGWSVLIVDADFDAASPPVELKGAGVTLAQVLQAKPDDADAPRRLAVEAIEKNSVLRPNVSVVMAGEGLESSADALSGPNFQVFLEEATNRHDLVLMVGGDLRTPAAQVLLQRLDYGIVCMVPGRTSSDVVEAFVEELGDRGVVFLGATFLHRRGGSLDRKPRRVVDLGPPLRELDVARDRLVPSRELDVRRTSQAGRVASVRPPTESARNPRGGSGNEAPRPRDKTPVGGGGGDLHGLMVQALTHVEQGSYEDIARFMVDCVTALMTDPPNESDFSNDALIAARSGFLPLHDVKGYESVSSVLTSEFRSQLGPKLGSWLSTEAAWTLSEGFGATGATLTLDQWLAYEYFPRHIDASGNEPTVWHLASRHGTVQVLVDSARLNQDCIDDLRGSVVQRTIDALERNLKSAVRGGKAEAVERLGEHLTDARTFEIALGWLYEGTTPNARLVYPSMLPDQQPRGWNPDWTEGVKPNIAPLQRLGLLARPVLTDEELRSLRPTA